MNIEKSEILKGLMTETYHFVLMLQSFRYFSKISSTKYDLYFSRIHYL